MDIDFYNILNLESTYYLQHYYKQALKHGLFTWNWYTCPHSAKIFIDRQFDGYLLWYLRYLCRWWFCRQVTQCQVERPCDLQNWRTLLPIRFDWVSTPLFPTLANSGNLSSADSQVALPSRITRQSRLCRVVKAIAKVWPAENYALFSVCDIFFGFQSFSVHLQLSIFPSESWD